MENELFSWGRSLAGFFLAIQVSLFALGADAPSVERIPAEKGDIVIRPINHATLTLEWNGQKIFVDPDTNGSTLPDSSRRKRIRQYR
jgi:hypothetical protein